MGREKNSSLFSFTTQKCPCALFTKERSACCDDQHEIIKIDDDQAGGQVLHTPSPDYNLIGELYTIEDEIISKSSPGVDLLAEVVFPPPKGPLYQSFCSLVLYEKVA
jgi:hypothetical protein